MQNVFEELKIKARPGTVYPVVNTMLAEFSLRISPSQLHDFRQAVLHCIPYAKDREIFSNENWSTGEKKTIVRYPLIQFRDRSGHAAIWAMQEGVPLLYRFIQEYKNKFKWQGKPFELNPVRLPIESRNFSVRILSKKDAVENPPVYHLYYYIPFINENDNRNYDWFNVSRNFSDIEKTKKLQELLTSHVCTFIHYSGGYIPKTKLKVTILDKKLLEAVRFKGRVHVAYDIRYTVNLHIPDFTAIGNKCSHGFGWQRREV